MNNSDQAIERLAHQANRFISPNRSKIVEHEFFADQAYIDHAEKIRIIS